MRKLREERKDRIIDIIQHNWFWLTIISSILLEIMLTNNEQSLRDMIMLEILKILGSTKKTIESNQKK